MQWLVRGGRGRRVGLLLYLPLGDRWGWVVYALPQRLYPQGRFPLPVAEGWVSLWTGLAGVEKRKSVAGPGFRPRTVQPVASHYTVSIFWREFVLRMKSERLSETSTNICGLHSVSKVRTAVLNCEVLVRACLL